jgi:hypothetical protein
LNPAQSLGVAERNSPQAAGIVRHDVLRMVPRIRHRLEYFHLQLSDFCPFKPANQLLRLAGKHTTANNFHPAGTLPLEMWF